MQIGKLKKGETQTVLGTVDPSKLGVTLTHEHLLIDLSAVFVKPSSEVDRSLSEEPVNLHNLGWMRINWSSNKDNLVQNDVMLAIREAGRFRDAGGGTLVDVTSVGIHRNPKALVEISRATGVHIVMGSGYYIGPALPEDFSQRTVDNITEEIVRDIQIGVGESGVRSGIIGEIGGSWPWTKE